ncbi:MAG: TetR/AcrR family transcriptional regulator [Bdellovibrionaceae bacterium]|nr:TetR/AcrR family transcriptional regulator [Pseudobdellovibrionaceae bacterium]
MRHLSEEKRQLILAAALECFLHSGPKKTSMGQVARIAGLATGGIYLYYRDKDHLVQETALQFAEVHRLRVRDILDSPEAADEKLRAYVLERFDVWEKLSGPGLVEFTAAVLKSSGESLQKDTENWFRSIEGLLTEGVRTKLFRRLDVKRDAEIFLLAIMGFFPMPGLANPNRPGRAQLLKLVEWFIEQWRS